MSPSFPISDSNRIPRSAEPNRLFIEAGGAEERASDLLPQLRRLRRCRCQIARRSMGGRDVVVVVVVADQDKANELYSLYSVALGEGKEREASLGAAGFSMPASSHIGVGEGEQLDG